MSNMDDIVNNAKESLIKQQKAINEANNSSNNIETEDLYADLRDEADETYSENVNSDNNTNYKLKNIPDEQYEYEKLDNSNNESDYEYNANISENPEEIFPGGPTMQQINAWKKQYGNKYTIFVIKIEDMYFIARNINRYEYKQLVALENVDALQREEIICETAILFPYNVAWNTIATDKAGLPSTLSEIIMTKSGFTKEYMIQVI